MTTALVNEEIKRFLASDRTEVLCIKGRWGVGKTHTWDEALKAAVNSGEIKLKRYAYVSLFGQNSLDDLRYALFENSATLSSATVDNSGLHFPDFKELEKIGRNSFGFLKVIPALNAYLSNANRSFFLLVRHLIICFDDLERAGKGLETKDVLGLISFLKERRKCKVILLLNDEALSEKAQIDFRTQLEKVADTILEFSPTSAEAARIAFPDETEMTLQLRQCCETLGIVNIRVMDKISRLIERLQPLLSDFDEGVLKQAIPSITLFAWAVYQPDDAPKIDFITSYNRLAGLMSSDRKTDSDEVKSWRSLLNDYGFTHMDAFDHVLLDGVRRGDQARELLDFFMQNRDESANFFDLDHHPFETDIIDPDLKKAFADRFGDSLKTFDIGEAILRIAKRQGWKRDDLDFLAASNVDDYVNLFKQLRGEDLRIAIDGALQFGKLGNGSSQMNEICAKASEALKQIAQESPINARRVGVYGIIPDNPPANEP